MVRFRRFGFVILGIFLLACTREARAEPESPQRWYRDGRAAVERAKRLRPNTANAKNVILFLGDGMGISTVTAARILDGQHRGQSGEENLLSFERLPYTALIKTYNTDLQTPDSAGTMTAIVTGVKTRYGVLSVDQTVQRGAAVGVKSHELVTILELAEERGLSTGVVSTTSVTHATPAACYAHTSDREWQNDTRLSPAARAADVADIARQLIEFPRGNGLEVVLGGGRAHFRPQTAKDPEYPELAGQRADHRDLTKEWCARPGASYVWSKSQFEAIDVKECAHLLGLFEPRHMHFEHDRHDDSAGEPSLSEMTAKAIDLLSKNAKGFFLMVEGGRIDHAHHACNAFQALTDTVEFSEAVRVAMEKTQRSNTLIVVTADHSHVLTMGGYSKRGSPILGKVLALDTQGAAENKYAADTSGKPYTTLLYANGPGYRGSPARPDLRSVNTEDPAYLQETAVPLLDETHSGEDVPLYAGGPKAYLFHGVLEQNVIFHIMIEALGWTESMKGRW